jgi:hypothetical protein
MNLRSLSPERNRNNSTVHVNFVNSNNQNLSTSQLNSNMHNYHLTDYNKTNIAQQSNLSTKPLFH